MEFYKYQGTGNDFILIDNRDGTINLSPDQIKRLCHRRTGIGADGLMLLESSADADFSMVYFNSDGKESTMCGNGGRCIVRFANSLGLVGTSTTFSAIDGKHTAQIATDGIISLHMRDVADVERRAQSAILNTGSPHYVTWVNNVGDLDVFNKGRHIRNSAEFLREGINVNFAEQRAGNSLFVRTYERGVEDETLSCGTGVVAAAIATTGELTGIFSVEVDTLGGRLHVSFHKYSPTSATDIVLSGPAKLVYTGIVDLQQY